MSEETKGEVEELMELLTKEQTLIGKYHGHSGQQKVALREAEYWNTMLAKMDDTVEEYIKRKWQRNLQKAKARAEYHAKMSEEARRELEEVRKRIREIIGGEEK